MVRHIVLWCLKAEALGATKELNAQRIKQRLEALNGRIPGLQRLDLGIDFSHTNSAADIALCADFDTRAALDAYLTHPEHVAAGQLVKAVVEERWMVDFEV
jgi:hypothetical protein